MFATYLISCNLCKRVYEAIRLKFRVVLIYFNYIFWILFVLITIQGEMEEIDMYFFGNDVM